MYQNHLHLFQKRSIPVAYTVLVSLSGLIWWYFTDTRIMLGNYGKIHTYIDIGLSIIMIVGFPLFLVGLYYKGMLFWNTKQPTKKDGWRFFFSKWTRTIVDWKLENDIQWTVPQWMEKWKISQLKEKVSFSKTNILGTLGGTIGTIVSWSSCCGLTLASYFGLLPLMNILPYSGLEIKIIGTLGLLYALYDILKNLETCTWKKK